MSFAYSEKYINHAQNVMGEMLDFAVNSQNVNSDKFFRKFISTGAAKKFGNGDLKYIAKMSGYEIAKEVLHLNIAKEDCVKNEEQWFKSPEYWAGWAICYYQWYKGIEFFKIQNAVAISEIINMYSEFHNVDIEYFVEAVDIKYESYHSKTNLNIARKKANLSQEELADISGVSLWQIRAYEQRSKKIINASAIDVVKLAKALNCNIEYLLEL